MNDVSMNSSDQLLDESQIPSIRKLDDSTVNKIGKSAHNSSIRYPPKYSFIQFMGLSWVSRTFTLPLSLHWFQN